MIHPVDSHVGARLRLLRKSAKLSQTELGKALGLTFQQVQKYERGTNRVSASKLYDAARLLNVPISTFFEGFEAVQQSDSAVKSDDPLEHRDLQRIVRAFEAVPAGPQRKRLLDLIEVVGRDDRSGS